METFFPSEVARLVLGYLKEEKCLRSWQTFLDESSKLEEYCNLYKKGKVYSTNVNGYSLLDVLKEYCELKSKIISNDSNKLNSPVQAYHISESDFLEAIRKDVFLETTKNTIDSVFQKYLSSSVLSDQNCSSHNSSNEVHSSESRNFNFRNKKYENSCSVSKTGLNTDECCEKQDKMPDIINGIKNKNRTCYQDVNNLNASKTDTEVNILKKDNNALKHLEVYNYRHQQSNCTGTNAKLKNSGGTSSFISRQSSNHDSLVSNSGASDGCNKNSHIKQKLLTSLENLSALNFDCTVKESIISLTEPSQNDDVEVEIIKEIKIEKLNDGIQPNQSKNCQNDLMTNNCPSQSNHVINVENNNNNNNDVTVNQATICNVQPIVTEVDSLKQKVNSLESDPVRNTQVNNLPNEIKQAIVCNSSAEVNQNYNPKHVGDSANDKTNYNMSTSSFLNMPTVIDEIQPTSTEYILPNYSSGGSFANNNTQYYIFLNTPMNSSVSGTYMTIPGIQTNVSNPVLPAVSTTFVKNSVSEVLGVSTPLPTIATAVNRTSVPASEIKVESAHGNVLTTSKVSFPETSGVTQSTLRTSKTVPRGQRRISYTQFLESEPDESVSSTARKRKKIQRRLSPKKKSKRKDSLSVADELKLILRASKSKSCSTEEIDVLNVTKVPEIKKTPNKKKMGKKCSYNKKKGMAVSNVLPDKNLPAKKKQGASYTQLENHFEYHPTNASKNIGVKKKRRNKVTECGISVSSCSDIPDNSQHIVSKTTSENIDQSALFNDNRVLKVVLSDMFQKPNLEPDASCNWHPQSNLVQDNDIEDQDSHLNQSIQSKRSPQKCKMNAGHLSESKSTDTLKLQQIRTKLSKNKDKNSITNFTNLPLKTKRKLSQSKNESRNSFDMKTAVLNSMEEARHSITDPKKYSASFATKELNSQNLFKGIAVEPQSTFQTVRDMCKNMKCIKTECKDLKNSLFSAGDRTSLQSQEIEDSLKFSLNKSSKIDQNTVTLSCNNSYKNGTSNGVAVCCLSSSEDSHFEICNSLPEKLFKKDLELNHETRKIISLKDNDKSSLNNVDVENEIAVRDCAKEKKMLVTNSLSNLHQVNVSTRLKTCVARELKFGEKLPFFCSKSNALDKEDSRHLSSEIFKAESGTFNSINIGEGNSNFIHHTEETNVFSVLTSISTNTKVLGVTEMHNVIKPDPDVLDVSSLRGKVPSTSDQPLDP